MSYPELYSDERIVLQAQNVKVKSVVFEVVLTTRRLVLIDAKKGSIPPQEINLATLKDVESGENAIRDPTITISIITISGNTRQMVLTFSKMSGGERRREAEEWVRALRQNITSTVYHPVAQAPAPKETVSTPAPVQPPIPQPPAAQQPAVQPPVQVPHRVEVANPPPPKKRIEIARPMKKIVEAAPAMPVPVETSSLPSGSFCNRCGSRIPPESAFCNRCGTPVVRDNETPAEEPVITWEQYTPPAEVPQVQVNPSPVYPTISEKKDRPIEQVIHSIEPLIEDSVPRTAPAPLVPQKQVHPVQQEEIPPAAEAPTAAPAAAEPAESGAATGDIRWPILTPGATPLATSPSVPPVAPQAPPAVPPAGGSQPPAPARGRSLVRTIAIIALACIVLAVIGGVFILMQQGQAPTPAVTPTPTIAETTAPAPETTVQAPVRTTIPATTQPQPAKPSLQVPPSGVFVKVMTTSKYSGSVGTPGRLRDVEDTGDHIYQISTSAGPVTVNIQKTEGTSVLMTVDVYKDGALVRHAQTTAPKGLIEFEASLAADTPATTTVPTTAAAT